jgi:hypothetical protein
MQRIKDSEEAKAVNIEHVESGSRHIRMVSALRTRILFVD